MHDKNGIESVVKNMLVLAKVELIFIIVASVGLCFGFGLEVVLISIGMFPSLLSSVYTEPRADLFVLLDQQAGWGCIRSWERGQMGQVIPAEQRDNIYPVTS